MELHICRSDDIKLYLLYGTEVDEEAFSCLVESAESGTRTFTVCNGEWISDVNEVPSSSTDMAPSFVSKVELPWKSLSHDVIDALNSAETLKPPQRQEVVRMIVAACQRVKERPSEKEIRSIANHAVSKYPRSFGDPASGSSPVSSVGLA